jgi:hypothetical protein
MPDTNTNWTDVHVANWRQWLAPYVGKPCRGLEVGCFEGRSTRWFLDNICTHPESRMTVLDTFAGGADQRENGIDCSRLLERFQDRMGENLWYPRVVILRQRSSHGLAYLLTYCLQFDFIYIDGSHEAEDVLTDSALALRLVAPGGVIIWDDYSWAVNTEPWRRPRTAIDACLTCTDPRRWDTVSHGPAQYVLRRKENA